MYSELILRLCVKLDFLPRARRLSNPPVSNWNMADSVEDLPNIAHLIFFSTLGNISMIKQRDCVESDRRDTSLFVTIGKQLTELL